MQKLYNRNAVPRGFEVARGFEDKGIVLPYRTTRYKTAPREPLGLPRG